MAKTITLNEAPAVANATATAIAGGGLAIGTTYYYRIVAIGPGTNYYGSNSASFWLSSPSIEVSATTDSTNRTIQIYFENIVDSNGYDGECFAVFRSTTSGDYDVYDGLSSSAHLLRVGTAYYNLYGILKNSLTVSGSGYTIDDTGAFALANFPFFEEGVPCWEIEGGTSADPIIPEDLYNWAVTNSKTYCIDKWDAYPSAKTAIAVRTCASIRQPQPGTTDLYFAIPDRTYFLQQWGKTWFDDDGHFITGKNGEYPLGGGVWQRLGVYSWYSGGTGDFECYEGTLIGSPRTSLYYSLQTFGVTGHMFQLSGSGICNIYNSLYEPRGSNANTGRLSPQNLDLQGDVLEIKSIQAGSPDAIVDDCKIIAPIGALYHVRQGKWSNSKLLGTSSHDFRGYNNSATEDQVNIMENMTFTNNPPVFYGNVQTLTNIAWQVILEQYTVNLNILDENNNPIEGAKIEITDINGNKAMFLDSGENLTEQISIGETDWNVSDGSVFSVNDYIRVNKEVCKITAVNSNTISVDRGQEGTEDRQYASNQKIFLRSPYVLTDSSGDTTTIPIVKRCDWFDPTDYTTTGARVMPYSTLFGPHTIKITKSGYKDYISTFDLTKKFDEVITLKKIFIDDFNIIRN